MLSLGLAGQLIVRTCRLCPGFWQRGYMSIIYPFCLLILTASMKKVLYSLAAALKNEQYFLKHYETVRRK